MGARKKSSDNVIPLPRVDEVDEDATAPTSEIDDDEDTARLVIRWVLPSVDRVAYQHAFVMPARVGTRTMCGAFHVEGALFPAGDAYPRCDECEGTVVRLRVEAASAASASELESEDDEEESDDDDSQG